MLLVKSVAYTVLFLAFIYHLLSRIMANASAIFPLDPYCLWIEILPLLIGLAVIDRLLVQEIMHKANQLDR